MAAGRTVLWFPGTAGELIFAAKTKSSTNPSNLIPEGDVDNVAAAAAGVLPCA